MWSNDLPYQPHLFCEDFPWCSFEIIPMPFENICKHPRQTDARPPIEKQLIFGHDHWSVYIHSRVAMIIMLLLSFVILVIFKLFIKLLATSNINTGIHLVHF